MARANLGATPGLVAAAALLIDYVLTVAVSVAAGVAALTSAFPGARTRIASLLGVFFIIVIAFANLRGVRESGRIFAVPTYLFVVTLGVVVAHRRRALAPGATFRRSGPPVAHATTALDVVPGPARLLVGLHGVDRRGGDLQRRARVPSARGPQRRHHHGMDGGILGVLFLGISALASALGLTPRDDQTVVSQLARALFGDGLFYYLIQGSTMLILVLAANTSFADFPRLSSLLARDRYAPAPVPHAGRPARVLERHRDPGRRRGAPDRALPGARPTRSFPLYAVGVFISFTLSQAGMVRHWLVERGCGVAVAARRQRGRRGGDRRRDARHRRDEVQARGVDRRPPDPADGPRLPGGPPPLRARGRPSCRWIIWPTSRP